MTLTAAVALLPEAAFAQAADPFQSFTNFLDGLSTLLQTVWARSIGVIAVFVCGVLWLMGRMNFMALGSVVIGLILVFGADAIVTSVTSAI